MLDVDSGNSEEQVAKLQNSIVFESQAVIS